MDDLIKNLKEAAQSAYREIMVTAEVEAENHFKESFDNEGFTNKNLEKWQPVKRKKGGKILTGTGTLADTLDVKGSNGVLKVTSPTAYAQVHNEGGNAGRNGSAKIPKRQFIGPSEKLNETFGKETERIINKHLKTN